MGADDAAFDRWLERELGRALELAAGSTPVPPAATWRREPSDPGRPAGIRFALPAALAPRAAAGFAVAAFVVGATGTALIRGGDLVAWSDHIRAVFTGCGAGPADGGGACAGAAEPGGAVTAASRPRERPPAPETTAGPAGRPQLAPSPTAGSAGRPQMRRSQEDQAAPMPARRPERGDGGEIEHPRHATPFHHPRPGPSSSPNNAGSGLPD